MEMSTASLNSFLRNLRLKMAAATLIDQSDRQLAERFLAQGDEAAFIALLRRHGPMVHGVCWRVLHQAQEAEDAFQATFLVLARNLRSVRNRDSLSSWLHGVAYRVALKAKARANSRCRHERRGAARAIGASEDATWTELRNALDVELGLLPERWRLPLILCYLEGRTQDEAAQLLRVSKNTLRRRLAAGRTALGRRLRRGGLAPSVALATLLLSDSMTRASVPASLVLATVGIIVPGGGGVTPGVAALADGVLVSAMTKLNVAATVVAVVGGAALIAAPLQSAHRAANMEVTAQRWAAPGPGIEPRPGEAAVKPGAAEIPRGLPIGDRVSVLPAGSVLFLAPVAADGKKLAPPDQWIAVWETASDAAVRRLAAGPTGNRPPGWSRRHGEPATNVLPKAGTDGLIPLFPTGGFSATIESNLPKPSGTKPQGADSIRPLVALVLPVVARPVENVGVTEALWWSPEQAKSLFSPNGVGGLPTGPTLSGDKKTRAVPAQDGTIILQDVKGGDELHRLASHTAPVSALIFSHDGRSLVSASPDGAMHVWDVKSGLESRQFHGCQGAGILAPVEAGSQ
jgi:RNA polymerase sigma factor (sigma-70 family)